MTTHVEDKSCICQRKLFNFEVYPHVIWYLNKEHICLYLLNEYEIKFIYFSMECCLSMKRLYTKYFFMVERNLYKNLLNLVNKYYTSMAEGALIVDV